MSNINIEVAAKAGACYGVNRALEMALSTADKPQPVHTLGPLIHNPRVVNDLARQGVSECSSLEEAGSGTVVIRSHGTGPQTFEKAKDKGYEVVNATCPFVQKVQNNARELAEAGYGVVIVGEEGHAEVEGIRAWGGDGVIAVVESPEDLPESLPNKVGVVVQTTQSEERYNKVVNALEQRCGEVNAIKTICSATQQRQHAAAELAARADAMIVIGGRNSGNTRRLVEICTKKCPTYHIESEDELQSAWLEGIQFLGVTAGASTPQSHIDAVVKRLEELAR